VKVSKSLQLAREHFESLNVGNVDEMIKRNFINGYSTGYDAGWNECHDEDMKKIAALEEKLRVACEAFEEISMHKVCIALYPPSMWCPSCKKEEDTDGSSFRNMAREALAKIKGGE
jgi:hypothetical protein